MSAAQRETDLTRVVERVAALSTAQRARLADRLRDAQTGAPRLTAFVELDPTNDASTGTSDEALRAFLGARLPEYMIPVRFVAVERLPRTAAGKLDRSAVAALHGSELRGNSGAPPAAQQVNEAEPVSAAAVALLAIWNDVLTLDDVGLDDDFFEIGGDSLLSIRVIARAAREGMRIAPERFFERPTIRHLAAGIDAAATAALASAVVTATVSASAAMPAVSATGRAPLTPIQHWFLDAMGAHRDWWNQAYVLDVDFALDGTTLRAVMQALLAKHVALRLRLVEQVGVWQQEFPASATDVPARVVVLDGTDPADYAAQVAAEGAREHASLRLTDGRLFRAVLFEGARGWRRLLVLAHHVVVDGVSWAIVLDDLSTLLTQAATGAVPRLPEIDEGMSARAWALALEHHATAAAVADAAQHWLALPADGGGMPVDRAPDARRHVHDGRDLVTRHADAATETIVLDAMTTQRLLQEAPRRLEASAQSLLLAALLLAWHSWTGTDVLSLDLEGHGRDALGPGMDVSRTVGWFTTVFPVRLSIHGEARAGVVPTDASVIREVQRTLTDVPMRGAAHGLARFLTPDGPVKAQLAARARSTMLFNYLGTYDLALPAESRVRVTGDASGDPRSPRGARPYLLELNARVEDGCLVMSVEYARTVHATTTMQHFTALVAEALGRVANATADDAPAAGIIAEGVAAGLDAAGLDAAGLDAAGLDAAGVQAVADLLVALDETDDEMDDVSGIRAR